MATDWLEVSKTTATLCMAIIAYKALNTWKDQSKAKIVSDFLNELTESVHEYILLMSAPKQLVKFVEIGIKSHSISLPGEIDMNIKNPNFVRYIKHRGQDESLKIQTHLNTCRPLASKIASLVAKGQVFGLKNYKKCQNSCEVLLWEFNYIEALSVIIGSDSLNWENELVQDILTKYSQPKAEDLDRKMQEANSTFLEFVKESYAHIYK